MKRPIEAFFQAPVKRMKTDEEELTAPLRLLEPKAPRIQLTDSSWVDSFRLPDNIALSESEFEELWALRPAQREDIVMFGKAIKTPRWSQTFGHSYYYSGMLHKAKPMLPVLSRMMEWCKGRSPGLNGCLVNWYKDGDDYIGAHSDSETDIVSCSEIYSLSFGSTRQFVFHPKGGGPASQRINLTNGTLVIMGGTCQLTHKHSVPKTKIPCGRRINVTFRSFKKLE